ncbi:MAG: hypothetical protein QM752_00130 [Gammaproteobacteria bacterium]
MKKISLPINTYSFLKADEISEPDRLEILALLENFFQTEDDPEQMPLTGDTQVTWQWIKKVFPECVILIKDQEKIVGSTSIFPSTKAAMEDFIAKKESESSLFSRIHREDVTPKTMQAIYLCTAFIREEYRNCGLATQALLKSINSILPNNREISLFYWAYSDAGKILAEKISSHLKLPLLFRP